MEKGHLLLEYKVNHIILLVVCYLCLVMLLNLHNFTYMTQNMKFKIGLEVHGYKLKINFLISILYYSFTL